MGKRFRYERDIERGVYVERKKMNSYKARETSSGDVLSLQLQCIYCHEGSSA